MTGDSTAETRVGQDWSMFGDWSEVAANGRGGAPDDEEMYDLDGSDLYIASPAERLERVSEHLMVLEGKVEAGSLRMDDIDMGAIEEANRMKLEFQKRLDSLSLEHNDFSLGMQDWVIEELRMRENKTGVSHEQGSEQSHLMTIDVLDELLIQLYEEEEDVALIELVDVWRKETIAEVSGARLQELYRLAA